jgi:UDP-glucose 4-epimerase
VLVTGGLGFLGSAVTRQLVDGGHEVAVTTSRPGAHVPIAGVRTMTADIRNAEEISKVLDAFSPDAVCHLAALTRVRDSFENPTLYYGVNVGGTIALLDALTQATPEPVRVVYASTGAVYGPAEGRVTEDHPTQPTNPYGASKLAAEQLLAFQAASGAVGAVTVRCFNIAGACDGIGDGDTSRIIPKALAVAAGTAGQLDINGDGDAVREFTHVRDVATAMVQALAVADPGKSRVYNLGSGVPTTMAQVVEAAERITNRPITVQHRPPAPEPAILMADSARIRADLGWQPAHSTLDRIISDAWAATPHT